MVQTTNTPANNRKQDETTLPKSANKLNNHSLFWLHSFSSYFPVFLSALTHQKTPCYKVHLKFLPNICPLLISWENNSWKTAASKAVAFHSRERHRQTHTQTHWFSLKMTVQISFLQRQKYAEQRNGSRKWMRDSSVVCQTCSWPRDSQLLSVDPDHSIILLDLVCSLNPLIFTNITDWKKSPSVSDITFITNICMEKLPKGRPCSHPNTHEVSREWQKF